MRQNAGPLLEAGGSDESLITRGLPPAQRTELYRNATAVAKWHGDSEGLWDGFSPQAWSFALARRLLGQAGQNMLKTETITRGGSRHVN
jgi:hypothetical protein